MSNTRFIGCLHLGHQWMAKRRGFANAEAHDEFLIETYNSINYKPRTLAELTDKGPL